MSFKNMKKNRSDAINNLISAAEKAGGKKQSYGDDNIWKPTRDKGGNGYAVIRFLPPPEGEELPWVQYWDHGFQGPGGWYIENSLTTLGQDDPVSEYNSQLWNSGREEDKEIARKQKRRLHYVANIYVVTDSGNPANEGKVMRYKFGKKIFDKVMDVMQPQFQDETPINPFDFWEGAEFKVKVRKVEGWVNYDSSEFDKPSEFMGGDEAKLEKIYNQLEPLSEFVDPKNYKTYAELKAKLNKVLGTTAPMSTAESISMDETKKAPTSPTKRPEKEEVTSSAEDEDDITSYFAALAED